MKQAGGETLYLKVDRNVQVHDKKVTIGDLAQILCTDKQTENLVKTIKVPQATNGKPGRHTMSVISRNASSTTPALLTRTSSLPKAL